MVHANFWMLFKGNNLKVNGGQLMVMITLVSCDYPTAHKTQV